MRDFVELTDSEDNRVMINKEMIVWFVAAKDKDRRTIIGVSTILFRSGHALQVKHTYEELCKLLILVRQ